jgi:hypothetical protein
MTPTLYEITVREQRSDRVVVRILVYSEQEAQLVQAIEAASRGCSDGRPLGIDKD